MSNADELRAERDFLLERARAEHLRLRPGDVGMSSQAMLLHAMGVAARPMVPGWTEAQKAARAAGAPLPSRPRAWHGEECGQSYPHDEDDLGRCQRTYDAAPAHLQRRMLPVLDEFRAWVLDGTNRYGWSAERAS